MNVDGTKGTKQAKQLKNRTNSLVSTEDTYSLVVGITEECRAQRISLGCNREGGVVVVAV